MLFVTWVKKLFAWSIIGKAQKKVKNLTSDEKKEMFFPFCEDNLQVLKSISCEKIKDMMLGELAKIFEVDDIYISAIKLEIEFDS